MQTLKPKIQELARAFNLNKKIGDPPSGQQLPSDSWPSLHIMSITVKRKRKLILCDLLVQDGVESDNIRTLYIDGDWRPTLTPEQIVVLTQIITRYHANLVFETFEENHAELEEQGLHLVTLTKERSND